VGNKDTLYKGGEHSDTSVAIVAALLDALSIDNARIYINNIQLVILLRF
jgi:hypothetical protein